MNSSVQLAFIICGVIGLAFLILALVLIFASLSGREKKQKVVTTATDTGFFAATDSSATLRAAQRTNAMQATRYADLTDLPGENSSQGVQSIKPLSHTELLGQLNDDDEEERA